MNRELVNIFNQNQVIQNFNILKSSIASPEDILSGSFGEVIKPEAWKFAYLEQELPESDLSVIDFALTGYIT